MDKDRVLDIILSTKVIAVIRMPNADAAGPVITALRGGGIKAIEVTITTPRSLELIASLVKSGVTDAVVGAGTVLDEATAVAAIHAGAEFLVSPVTRPAIIEACRRYDRVVAPGAFTPTEVITAWEAGADIVKIFPATSVGPGYFKDLKGPLPRVRLMPTGGVTLENAGDFIRAGACCVGVGTALLDRKAIAEKDWQALSHRARTLIESVAKI